ncbi:uncharacterized protein [Triticum aestivum]|uniref:uncharacterized protein n=1 Tax=Triticum aestivum TaxID=4565 RepID=UPI001D02865C|nr:uncharacterized protein LOC123157274 [Triticum aestivum]
MSRSPPRQDSVSYQIIWLLWTWRPLVTFLVLINSLLLKYYCVASGRAPLLDYQRRGCATGLSPRATATAAVISPVGGGLVHDHVTSAVALGGCPRPPPLLRGARQAQRLRAGTYITKGKFGAKVKKETVFFCCPVQYNQQKGVKFYRRIFYCIKRRRHLGTLETTQQASGFGRIGLRGDCAQVLMQTMLLNFGLVWYDHGAGG